MANPPSLTYDQAVQMCKQNAQQHEKNYKELSSLVKKFIHDSSIYLQNISKEEEEKEMTKLEETIQGLN